MVTMQNRSNYCYGIDALPPKIPQMPKVFLLPGPYNANFPHFYITIEWSVSPLVQSSLYISTKALILSTFQAYFEA